MRRTHEDPLPPEIAQWVRDVAVALLPHHDFDLVRATAAATEQVVDAMLELRGGVLLHSRPDITLRVEGETWALVTTDRSGE